MGLSLRGTTSGAIDINAPAVAGDNTITLPGNNGSANQFFKNSGTAGIVTFSSMVETPAGDVTAAGAITASGRIESTAAAGPFRSSTTLNTGAAMHTMIESAAGASNKYFLYGTANGVQTFDVRTNGAINATGNFSTGGSIISEANPETSDTTNGAMLDKVKVVVRNAAGQSVWLGYKNGTSGATSSINVDGDTTIRDLTVRTVTSSDQVISNRSGTSVCFRAQDSGTDNLQILANGKVQSGSNYPDGDGVNIFAGGSIYIRQDGATGGVLRIRNGSDYKIELKGNGSAAFAGGAFNIEADGDISTNVKLHGNIQADSTGVYTDPKFEVNAATGNGTFRGSLKIGGSAAANQIDEYEEGTWSPTIGGTATYDIQWGYYIKIGKLVQLWGGLRPNSMGTGNAKEIHGLPYQCIDSPGSTYSGGGTIVWCDNSATSFTNTPSIMVDPNAYTARIGLKNSASTTLQDSYNFWQNNHRANFFITYYAKT